MFKNLQRSVTVCHPLRTTVHAVVVISLLVLPAQKASSEGPAPDSGLSENLLEEIYRPLHFAFADSAQEWAVEVSDLCEQRPTSSVYKMQLRFAKLVELYAAIELYRVGPLLEDNLQNRIFYWPDKRRVGQRQLRSLMTSVSSQSLSVEALANKSVAVQGFTALERLLFKPEYQPIETDPQCRLIPVIVSNIARMANELSTAWHADSEFVQSLLTPKADSQYFRSFEEIQRNVFTQAKVGLDVVLDGKLRPLLSNDPKVMPQTPLWVSQRTVSMLTGNLKGLRALLLDSGLLRGTRFEDEFRIEFDYIDHVLLELKPLMYYVEPEGQLRPEIKVLMHKLAAVVSGVRFTLTTEVSNELGMRAGFNSEDGD